METKETKNNLFSRSYINNSLKELYQPQSLEKYLSKINPILNRNKKGAFRRRSFFLYMLVAFFILIGSGAAVRHFFLSEEVTYAYLKGPCSNFVGRQKYLDILYKELLAGQKSNKFCHRSRIKVLWGRGGFGKSELAIEFANRYFSHFSLIWTFVCDSQEQIDQSYRHLADQLGVTYQQQEPSEKIREKVHLFLENHSFKNPWLLIFDNVEQDSIEYPQRGGMVLMTSQKRILNPEFLLEIIPFSSEEAFELLEKVTGEKRSEAMEQLFKDLEGIPLLIHYAAQYIKATPGFSINEYQKLLSSHLLERESLLWKEIDTNRHYLKSLAASWQFPLKSLEKENPLALQWLYICSYLHPEHICEEWIDVWLEEKMKRKKNLVEAEKKEILKALNDYGIIRYDERTKTFFLHRFFQYMIRESRKEYLEEDLRQTISLLAAHAEDYHFEKPSAWRPGEWWYLHACEVRKWLNLYDPRFSEPKTRVQEALLYEGIMDWCTFNDLHAQALEANDKALEIRDALLEEVNPELGTTYTDRGWVLYKLARYSEGLAACNKAQQLLYLLLKERPLDYARTLHTKGLVLWRQGEFQEALKCHQEGLKIRLENLREDHLNVGRSYSHLGLCLCEMGQYQDALSLYEKVLNIYEKNCGSQHSLFGMALQNKAWVLLEQGQYKESLKLFQKALSLHISIRGKNHGDLVYAWNGIGWCHLHLGKIKKARRAFKKALRNGLASYGQNTPYVIRAYNGIGWSYIKEGKSEKGLDYLILQLHICSTVYENTPRMDSILKDFKIALQILASKGEKIDRATISAYKISEKTLGKNHPFTRSFKEEFKEYLPHS